MISNICPYLKPEVSLSLDKLLMQLDGTERLDKLQQLGYHLQNKPDMKPDVINSVFNMNDANLAKFCGMRSTSVKNKLLEEYHALVKQPFDELKSDGVMKCRQCGSKEVSWTTQQTRKADEGSTVFCECKNCLLRWRM